MSRNKIKIVNNEQKVKNIYKISKLIYIIFLFFSENNVGQC